jgi:hypothetical protein
MVPAVTISIAFVLVVLALWGAALFVIGHPPSRSFIVVAVIVEAELVLHAGAALIAIAAGHETESLPQYLGYAFASVVLLPVVLRPGQRDARTRWDAISIAVVSVALSVAVLRLLALW